ncbi:MAG: DUF1016 domain-containing protein [Planctomycetes bacterium]|nr:DUF1016 domain-containing protein [Planctomycetota bacterium]
MRKEPRGRVLVRKVGSERSGVGRRSSSIEARERRPQGSGGSYARILSDLKGRIARGRLRTVLAANAELVRLYWEIGRVILTRQHTEGWGAQVIDRLARDFGRSFPDMRGLSARNLKYMRAFAAAWPRKSIVQAVLAQLSWYHNLALLEKLDDADQRLWYAREALRNGWSRNVLAVRIATGVKRRTGQAVTNFRRTLPPAQSDMAADAFKDPYVFDFLGAKELRRERDLEQALIDHIQRFLLELGSGFAFVGRQVPLEVGDQDFQLDLFFYHLQLRCYVVVELKTVPFDASFVGQLSLYLSAVDDQMRHAEDRPTLGLILCRTKNAIVVEYALRNFSRPIGVADWETKLVKSLPRDLANSLPSASRLRAALSRSRSKPPPLGEPRASRSDDGPRSTDVVVRAGKPTRK